MYTTYGINPMSQLLQSPAMRGKTNLTCNAWQASNTEGYFAVTGHWIEELITSRWELKSASLGFTQVYNAYDGKRLGQALYKKLLSVSELSTRSVRVLSSHVYAPPDHALFRLATLLATTQVAIARC